MATQAQLDKALVWARAQVGKPYELGAFGARLDCSTYMSGIATMIRDGVASRWFTTHPFHSGSFAPLAGWERGLEAPFMIGIQDSGVGHTGGTLLGIDFEATAADDRIVRSSEMDSRTRGAKHSYYDRFYGFRPSLLATPPPPPPAPEQITLYYNVTRGQSLLSAAVANDLTVAELRDLNLDKDILLDDQKLVVGFTTTPPPPEGEPEPTWTATYTVVSGDTLSKIANTYGITWELLYEKNQAVVGPDPNVISVGMVLKVPTLPAPPPPPPPPAEDPTEPAHNYTRVTYNPDDTVNIRTRTMLEKADSLLTAYSWTPYLLQGSYNPGVSSSAGTHDGGGVVDIRTSTMTTNGQAICVEALRKAGFAAWLRTEAQGFTRHIHAVAIGDREMSPSAADQVLDYFAGRNGLANNGPDDGPRNLWPSWCNKYNPAQAPTPPPPSTPGTISFSQIKYNERGDHPSGEAACEQYVEEALDIAGMVITVAWVNGLLTIAGRESAYNHPNWLINTTDSNAKNVPELNGGGNAPDGFAGQCSRGPWQTIPQTFGTYHLAGTSLDIYNPVASAGAAIRYIRARYGVAVDGSDLAAKVQQADPNRSPRGY